MLMVQHVVLGFDTERSQPETRGESLEGGGLGALPEDRLFAGTAARLSTRFCQVAPKGLVALTGSGGLGAMR